MPSRSHDPCNNRSIIDAERHLLQALCQESRQASALELARRSLADYQWREPIHGIIFRFVITQPEGVAVPLRDLLPGLLTRKGFPEVEWETFFQTAFISEIECADLIRELSAFHTAGPGPGAT